MKIAILGFAGQGQSSFEYWNTRENELTICDRDERIVIPSEAKANLGPAYLKNLSEFDLIVRTPIVHPREIVANNPENPNILDKVTSNTNEFFRVCPSKNIIGVTGTKGKGTTSTLIATMLKATGKKVHIGGNIGTPPLELLKEGIEPNDWVVLELANFQLIDLKYSPKIAVCLMVVPEHLDWHEDMEEYIAAKQQLFINQNQEDIAVYFADNEDSESIASASDGTLIPYFAKPGACVENDTVYIESHAICKTSEIGLLGKHNWQNVCAAITTIWQITQATEQIHKVLVEFTGLPYRIELVRTINNVRYYNDSFATAAGATIAAINAISGNKVLIIGGFDRGLDLTEISVEIKRKEKEIRKVLIIGASAQRTAEALDGSKYENYTISDSKEMNEIVKLATSFARPGDAIVLSPAFASFDMFKNFEERGNKFNEAVRSL
ncbi:MAG: UDP-N-acetylmuramoyl-L-alanine--D-glutamate ligase [Candidatus Saccharimonadales bacterium]